MELDSGIHELKALEAIFRFSPDAIPNPPHPLEARDRLERASLSRLFETFNPSFMSERTTYEVILEWDQYRPIPGRKVSTRRV
jgi:hypothetical protein